jgi:hypothetical protein
MPEIQLVSTAKGLRGYTQDDDRAWKRFKGWVKSLGSGEYFTLTYKRPRNVKFHRKLFALFNFLFEHWEPEHGRKRLTYKGQPIEKNFDAFRKELTILAGFYVASYDLKGRVQLDAQSLAFDSMDDDTFEKLYKAVIDVAIKHFLPTSYKTAEQVEAILAEVERFE